MTSVNFLPKRRVLHCRVCRRAFNKLEHLTRHERSHSGDKPFQCLACRKSYGRKDVLNRHLKLHEGQSIHSAIEESPISASEQLHERLPSCERAQSLPTTVDDDQQRWQELPPYEQETILQPQQLWCNSEDLLELLLSDTTNKWSLASSSSNFQFSRGHDQTWTGVPDVGCAPGRQAMHQMSTLIHDLTSNLAAEIGNAQITSAFLDTCMHLFFEKFNPTFPILHTATFVAKEVSNPLLLNIMAIGSLFIGDRQAIPKGETLWRLAHMAVTTSWQALMATRGPRDECDGVQLVLTALIGQIYAMLSKNESLRMTCQTFHALGFFWACQSGMYEVKPFLSVDVPSINSPKEDKISSWRFWAAREVQIRAVLGHYLLDGLISQFSGQPACVRHVANSLHTSSSDDAFAAQTADAWILEMEKIDQAPPTFREVFNSLFQQRWGNPSPKLCNFSIVVVLEGLQSLVWDTQTSDEPAIGTPRTSDIVSALLRLHDEYLFSSSSTEKTLLLIRWHTIMLNIATPYMLLCQKICTLYDVQHSLYAKLRGFDDDWSLQAWSQSPDGLRALLHSIAIQDLIESLPIGRSHAIHLPASVFAIATIYSALCMAGRPVTTTPQHVRWHKVWADVSKCSAASDHRSRTALARFLNDEYLSDPTNRSSRNLLYNLNALQATLNSISSRWGISHEMDQVVHRWTLIVNENSFVAGA